MQIKEKEDFPIYLSVFNYQFDSQVSLSIFRRWREKLSMHGITGDECMILSIKPSI